MSAVEHDAVFRAWPDAQVVAVCGDGLLSPDAVRAELVEAPPVRGDEDGASTSSRRAKAVGRALVCVQWCNSETGVRQPLDAIAAAVHAAGDLLLVDAAQAPAGTDLGAADFVVLSAHKRGGPPGVGVLLVRDLATLSPTGGQERGYRPGTENLPGVLGYAAALAEPEPVAHWTTLRARLDDAIARSGGEVVAGVSPRHPAIGSYRLPGVAQTTQLIRLDLAGIAVSAGSACASGSLKPSHVLAAMGWAEPAAREVIRVSFGRTTAEAEVERFIAAWRAVARATSRFAA